MMPPIEYEVALKVVERARAYQHSGLDRPSAIQQALVEIVYEAREADEAVNETRRLDRRNGRERYDHTICA